ncbi:hypothetical protein MRX96_048021 [Rhipicephalus microplus]
MVDAPERSIDGEPVAEVLETDAVLEGDVDVENEPRRRFPDRERWLGSEVQVDLGKLYPKELEHEMEGSLNRTNWRKSP